MENYNIEQDISTLIISPSNEILAKISSFLLEGQNHDLNTLISKYFQSLLTLEHWAWEILSRDSREWHDDEQEYFQLFSNLSIFNIKLILNNNINIKTKQSLLIPTNMDIINGIFQQIEKRKDENDQFLSIINIWFDALSLLIHEHIELSVISIIIYINKRIISDIIMNNQFKIYLNQLKNPCPLITIKQLFYIKTSIFLLNGYLHSKPQNPLVNGQQIIEYLAQDYTTILLIHSQTISSWSKEFLACITHLIGLISSCHWSIGINTEILKMFIIPNKTLYDYIESLIDILSYRSFHEQLRSQWLNNESILIDNILELFIYLTNYQDIKYYFYSKKNLIETFLIFDHINNDRIYLMTYRLQSEILTEKEIKKLNIANNINETFIYYLQQAWKNPLKIYNKIPIEELLKGLLNLSKNDIIKDAIINSNQLKFLIELSDKYSIVYDILWSLSFDTRIQEQLCLNEIFRNKLENNSTNKQIENIIQGIKWNLNLDCKINNKNSNKEKFDIIISYSHKDKLICKQIYNELIKNNYHVWIDLNEIHGNIIDGMVQAIEQSRIIIICMSEEYKRSNYCRAEAQYAFKKQLKIIPILIEKYYKPDGWLLFLIGSLFYIDFIKYQFSEAIQMLLNELKSPHIAVIDYLVVRQEPQNITNLPVSTLRSKDIRQWTQNDVQQWLNDNNLLHMAHLLSNLNGLDLIYLSQLISKNSPQENLILFQEDSINRTGRNISLIEIVQLHNLIEEQIPIPIKAKKIDSKYYCCRMM